MDINTTLTGFFNTILPSLSILIGALVSYLLVKLTTKIKTETKTIQDKATRDLLDKTLDNLTNLINVNVTSAGETIVKELKASTLDGTLSKDDAKNILEIVKGKVITQLSDSGKEALSTTISDLDGYIESAIETALKQIKAQTPSPIITTQIETIPVEIVPVKVIDEVKVKPIIAPIIEPEVVIPVVDNTVIAPVEEVVQPVVTAEQTPIV